MNNVEQIRRLTPTARMVAQIDSSVLFWDLHPFKHAGSIAQFLRALPSAKWLTIALAAGVEHATPRTIQRVIATFEERERTADVARKLLESRRELTGRERSGTR